MAMRERDLEMRPPGRRQAIRRLGGTGLGGAALVVAPTVRGLARRVLGAGEASAETCSATPALVEGPYYVAGSALRRNVIEHEAGVVLWLSLTVADTASCAPIPRATVE